MAHIMHQKTYVAYDMNCRTETEGLLKVDSEHRADLYDSN